MKYEVTFTYDTGKKLVMSEDLRTLGEAVSDFADNLPDRGQEPYRKTLKVDIKITESEQ